MSSRTTPLFVRLPAQTAAALDRLAGAAGRHKQSLVSEILSERLTTTPSRPLPLGRIEVSNAVEPVDEVLTLDEAAALLKVPVEAVRARAEHGDLPGRRFGTEWRFIRSAVLDWLRDGETRPSRRIDLKR
jgi:excisionase family DNA binding protein